MSSENRSSSAALLGTIIMIVGILWMTLSGLCSALVLVGEVFDGDPGGILQGVGIVTIVGGVSLLIGALIWRGGKALRGRR